MLAVQRKTPGVYVTELSAFPPSVVGVETAVPAFIGYTEKALSNHKMVTNVPVKISSLADFEEIFGRGHTTQFNLTSKTDGIADIEIGDGSYEVAPDTNSHLFYLYNSVRLFYANGGGTCYIVSVGTYSSDGVKIDALKRGLSAIKDEVGPTMLAVPDAIAFRPNGTDDTEAKANHKNITGEMLMQCGQLGDRVALLDVYGADKTTTDTLDQCASDFRSAAGTESLSYGMAYFPWLHTSIVEVDDIDYTGLTSDAITILIAQLKKEANKLYGNDAAKEPRKTVESKIDILSKTFDKTANQDLIAALPILKKLYAVIAGKLNILPPTGAIAGVYSYIDTTRGVWNAPANIGLQGVVGPTCKIVNTTQDNLNLPIEGKAINAIRDFVGRGTLVWGARTLDGNSNDYRYIQVRRTLIYIEQSIKLALNRFVFAPNDGQTWVSVAAMISNFLTDLWTRGGLMGGKASEAFSVQCGLGSTMTGNDILNGYMRVQVALQMIHPAEFIELTFTQKMQGVG